MPSDNSCLFTAFGGALQDQIPAQQLRRMMADFIVQNPEDYSEAVLGSSPSQYCRSIQDPDRWGGGIELSILSSIFNIQICTFDVQVSRNPMALLLPFIDAFLGPKLNQLWRRQAGSLYSCILWNSL
jgi:ubiquitin thioesterase OTU1